MIDFSRKFCFGLNLDDVWRYAGLREPRSIIIPHLLSVSLPESKVFEVVDEEIIKLHHQEEPKTLAEVASLALADRLKDSKVDFVRCWFPWRFFEPKAVQESDLDSLLNNSYSHWPTDTLVNALTSKGIDLIPVVGCGYSRMLPDGLRVDNYEDYLNRIAIHARLLVRKYKGKIRYWQIENEPDWWEMHTVAGWRSGAIWVEPKEFMSPLLRTLNEAVHSEDSNAQTIINLEGDAEGIDPIPYSQYCDFIAFDFYPNYKSPYPINLSVFRQANLASHAIGRPVLIIETGYPSGPRYLGYDEKKQAEYIKAACMEAYNLEKVNAIGIWRHADTSWRSFPEQENHFGLIDSQDKPKQAWNTFVETIGLVKGK